MSKIFKIRTGDWKRAKTFLAGVNISVSFDRECSLVSELVGVPGEYTNKSIQLNYNGAGIQNTDTTKELDRNVTLYH